MAKMKNLAGQRFSRLVALESTDQRSWGQVIWKCLCDCGKTCYVSSGNLSKENTKSCGCGHIKRGCTSKNKRTSEYIAWDGMKQRCLNPNTKHYKDWGGRGIVVCERWLKFENFIKDMGKKPSPELSIDRINNEGNYEPCNCRWATAKEQSGNTRQLIWFYGHGPNGEMVIDNNQHEVARVFGLDNRRINECLHDKYKQHKGWKFEYAFKDVTL